MLTTDYRNWQNTSADGLLLAVAVCFTLWHTTTISLLTEGWMDGPQSNTLSCVCTTGSMNQQLRTLSLTNKANTSAKHKQSIQGSDFNVLVSFLPACTRQRALLSCTCTQTRTVQYCQHSNSSTTKINGKIWPTTSSKPWIKCNIPVTTNYIHEIH